MTPMEENRAAPTGGTRPPATPERIVSAPGGFQDAAIAAVTRWGEGFTTRQGLAATWMPALIIGDLWVSTVPLSDFEVTGLGSPGRRP